MPRHEEIPGTPADWLARARGNLARARAPLPPGGFYEDACFDAHPAAEKAIKAVYRAQRLGFDYTHNLGKLLDRLRNEGVSLPPEPASVAALSDYASTTRYPGTPEAVTEVEYRRAVALAETVVRWAESVIEPAPK